MLYVNNPKDTAPKRLGRSEFESIIGSSEVARHCMWTCRYAQAYAEAAERGDALQMSWWEHELKQAKGRLPAFIFQGTMRNEADLGRQGTRNRHSIGSNGKVMIDIDHIAPEEIARIGEAIHTVREEDGPPFVRRVGFVAITPSHKGMRIVLQGREGSTLVDDQRWVARLLGTTIDECCKDYTRLSYAVPQSHVRYYAPEVLFAESKPYAEKATPAATHSHQYSPNPLSPLSPPCPLTDPYSLINQLEEELGGPPTRGSRNKFVYRMACSLRHLYGNDAESIFSAIPDYGLTDTERRHTIGSALRATIGSYMPRCIYKLKQP